jgi:hypothetical protein
MKLKVITQRRLPAVCREPSALSLTLGAQYLGEEVGHVGRLELIRRQVHDAAGDRRDRSAHPQVPPAIASSSAASLCAARKAAAGLTAAHASSRSAWTAEARTRSSPGGSSPAPIATAVCEPLCGSTPIITATMEMTPSP